MNISLRNPSCRVAFVLHERKFDRVHEVFFWNVRDKIPSLKQCRMVTDGESAIIKAVSSVMPEWKLVTCWNHILTDVEFWLKKHGASADEIAVYKNQMYELLRCETCVFEQQNWFLYYNMVRSIRHIFQRASVQADQYGFCWLSLAVWHFWLQCYNKHIGIHEYHVETLPGIGLPCHLQYMGLSFVRNIELC